MLSSSINILFVIIIFYTAFLSINHFERSFDIISAQTGTRNTTDTSIRSENMARGNTFSAIGQISSLVITVPESSFNITNAFKVILTGEWNLNVRNGTVTNFAVNFLASPMNGNKPHIHQITDFKPYDNKESIVLTEDKSVTINGTADIKINGVTVWDNTDISISISKGNTFYIDPHDVDTQGHFGNQSVLGIVIHMIL